MKKLILSTLILISLLSFKNGELRADFPADLAQKINEQIMHGRRIEAHQAGLERIQIQREARIEEERRIEEQIRVDREYYKTRGDYLSYILGALVGSQLITSGTVDLGTIGNIALLVATPILSRIGMNSLFNLINRYF